MWHHQGKSYHGLRDTAGKHQVAVPAFPVGGDPYVDLAVGRDWEGPQPVDVVPPEGRDISSTVDCSPGRNDPNEENASRQLPGDQVDRCICLTRPQHREAAPAQVLAGFVLRVPGPGAVSPRIGHRGVTHHHPDPAPDTRGVPDNAGQGTAFRPGGCRPSWSTCPSSGQRSAGTSSFSPSPHLMAAAFPCEDLTVSVENRHLTTHSRSPHCLVQKPFCSCREG